MPLTSGSQLHLSWLQVIQCCGNQPSQNAQKCRMMVGLTRAIACFLQLLKHCGFTLATSRKIENRQALSSVVCHRRNQRLFLLVVRGALDESDPVLLIPLERRDVVRNDEHISMLPMTEVVVNENQKLRVYGYQGLSQTTNSHEVLSWSCVFQPHSHEYRRGL